MPASEAAACHDVHKSYATSSGRVDALRGVDATFPAGAVTAVVGASGSGKSTLLRLLATLDFPSAGRVVVQRADLGSLAAPALRAIRRSRIAYVFQRPSDNFVSYLTLGEHLALAKRRAEQVPKDGDDLLAAVGLAQRVGHMPRQLSGGEQQRAAFALAVAGGARLVVADEPTAELDEASAAAVLEIVRRFADEGAALILATHDPGVRAIADDVVELEHGLVREGRVPTPLPRSSATRRDRGGETVARVAGVRKVYARESERVEALRGVDLELRSGELAALLGRSGSGKTTLLNVLAGWEQPSAGTVEFPRTPGAAPASLPWTELAVVPQRHGLLEELTVHENVAYPQRLAHADGARVGEVLEALALAELVERLPAETSIGQQQRVALARALVAGPRLLLADEPTSHQDARSEALVVRALHEAAAGGTCCLVATHSAELAEALDRTIAIADGRVTQSTGS